VSYKQLMTENKNKQIEVKWIPMWSNYMNSKDNSIKYYFQLYNDSRLIIHEKTSNNVNIAQLLTTNNNFKQDAYRLSFNKFGYLVLYDSTDKQIMWTNEESLIKVFSKYVFSNGNYYTNPIQHDLIIKISYGLVASAVVILIFVLYKYCYSGDKFDYEPIPEFEME